MLGIHVSLISTIGSSSSGSLSGDSSSSPECSIASSLGLSFKVVPEKIDRASGVGVGSGLQWGPTKHVLGLI